MCTAGSFGSQPGASGPDTCAKCVAGKTSVPGASICTSCVPGSYGLNEGGCASCSSGTFSTGIAMVGSIACSYCVAGKYSNEGASICTDCTAGSFGTAVGSDSPNRCVLCSAGTYSDSGASVCSDCPLGSRSSGSGAVAVDCKACTPGTYMIQGSTFCKACDAGKANANPGSHQESDCLPCEQGRFSFAGQKECSQCPYGTFVGVTGSTTCSSCRVGCEFDEFESTHCTDKTDRVCTPYQYKLDVHWRILLACSPAATIILAVIFDYITMWGIKIPIPLCCCCCFCCSCSGIWWYEIPGSAPKNPTATVVEASETSESAEETMKSDTTQPSDFFTVRWFIRVRYQFFYVEPPLTPRQCIK
mmetsp:Transcript_74238/g.198204  ORF Transcript_74238/g.198204 Transcript_74238/m.198204 type:complete len:360 (-) Transcript_74238:899-1978(-)